jgi:hypothetical protein
VLFNLRDMSETEVAIHFGLGPERKQYVAKSVHQAAGLLDTWKRLAKLHSPRPFVAVL